MRVATLAAMPRTARIGPGGVVFHVLNRGALRQTLFRSHKDYLAFMAALRETLKFGAKPCGCWLCA